MAESDLVFWCIAGFLFGLFLFVNGFKSFKLKRAIENIPTSKIRSLAMGIVEIYGTVVPGKVLKSPFSNKDCVYYKYIIEEYRKSGKNSRWVKIDSGEQREYFYIRDETGTVLVNPVKAQIEIPVDFIYSSEMGTDPPSEVVKFLNQKGISYEGLFGINKKMKYTEFFLAPNDKVYILGTAGTNPFRREDMSTKHEDLIMVQKGNNEIFFISDLTEKQILNSLKLKVIWGIWGGSAITVISLTVLFLYLGIL